MDTASTSPTPDEVQDRLARHLRRWLGAWPPTGGVTVVGSAARQAAGWDGRVRSLAGVSTPEGTILSVPPDRVAAVMQGDGSLDSVLDRLPAALGRPGGQVGRGAFRFATTVPDLGRMGEWVPAEDARVPAWLRPFGGEVLVVFGDDGRYVAGLGIKRHDDLGQEVAVATEEAWRGKGLARGLVARAARRILRRGGVPIYLHGLSNAASAHVAAAAGFPDLGWSIIGLPTAT
ncbi:MAG: GNAT family N-acetyltransferase [Actinomycetota bacterium]|nr:GNAT family N-acetyltransferase [Actinomycetota bacterium]